MKSQEPNELGAVGDVQLFIGGRQEAESAEWLREHNVKLIVSCASGPAKPYSYGLSEADGVQAREMPINYKGRKREQSLWRLQWYGVKLKVLSSGRVGGLLS